jgi:hypothetical protein
MKSRKVLLRKTFKTLQPNRAKIKNQKLKCKTTNQNLKIVMP